MSARTIVGAIFITLAGLAGCDTLRARYLAREGVEFYRQGQYEAAVERLTEAASLDGDMPSIQLDLGIASLAVHRSEGSKSAVGQASAARAIQAYERYLQLRPNDERVKLSLIQTFVDTNRYDDALAHFRPLVEGATPNPQALNTLAIVASKCGRPEEARKWYERRIAVESNNPDAHLALGVLLWEELHAHPEWPAQQRRQMAETGIEVLKKAIDLKPAAPNAYTYVNLMYRERAMSQEGDEAKRGDLEAAEHYYRMALERQGRGR